MRRNEEHLPPHSHHHIWSGASPVDGTTTTAERMGSKIDHVQCYLHSHHHLLRLAEANAMPYEDSRHAHGIEAPDREATSPLASRRTPALHPRREYPKYSVVELMRMNPLTLFFVGCIPPFIGAVLSIVAALTMHNDEISNYNWQCGRAKLPSLSRIINLPMERIFWQFTFLFHIPLRVVELGVGFHRYGRLQSVNTRSPKFYNFCRYLYAILGGTELLFLVALSVVGEREFISYHVIFFYAFGSFALGFYVTNAVCHANSLYYLNPYVCQYIEALISLLLGRISYWSKIIITLLYCYSIPILLGAFLLYWKKCITLMYDVFAIAEYADVFLTIAYHCCAFFDIRHKVIFSVRRVKHSSKMQ